MKKFLIMLLLTSVACAQKVSELADVGNIRDDHLVILTLENTGNYKALMSDVKEYVLGGTGDTYISTSTSVSGITGMKSFANGSGNGITFGTYNKLGVPSVGDAANTVAKFLGFTADQELAFDGKIVPFVEDLDKVYKHTNVLNLIDAESAILDFADKSSTSRYFLCSKTQTIKVLHWEVGGSVEFMYASKKLFGGAPIFKFVDANNNEMNVTVKWLNEIEPEWSKQKTYFIVLKNVGGYAIFSYAFVDFFDPFGTSSGGMVN